MRMLKIVLTVIILIGLGLLFAGLQMTQRAAIAAGRPKPGFFGVLSLACFPGQFSRYPGLALVFVGYLFTLLIVPLVGFSIWGLTDANFLVAIVTLLLYYYSVQIPRRRALQAPTR